MQLPQTSKRDLKWAAVLGIAAMVLNLLSHTMNFGPLSDPGVILLFLSAAALGVTSGMLSCAIAVLASFMVSGGHLEAIRLIFLCGAISYAGSYYPRVPPFIVASLVWLVILGPLHYGTEWQHLGHPVMAHGGVIMLALQEIIYALVAGSMLLDSELSGLISTKLRSYNLQSMLIHIVTTIAALSSFTVLWQIFPDSAGIAALNDAQLFLVTLGCIFIPAALAWRLADIINRDFRQIFSAQLIPDAQGRSFSGLSSDYWRRQDTLSSLRSSTSNSSGLTESEEQRDNQFLFGARGVCTVDRNGTIGFANRKFKTILEIPDSEITGKNIDFIGLNPEIAKHIKELAESTLKSGARATEFKLNQLPDKLRYLEIASQKPEHMSESTIAEGPDSVIITVRDITDRRTVESHLLQAQRLKSVGEVIGGLAHAFNNALTAITGNASFARHADDPSIMRRALDSIIASATESGNLVRKLLDFAEGKPAPMQIENLSESLESRMELLRRMAGEDYELQFEKPAGQIAVSCDTNLLTQALTNLVLNAKESYVVKPGPITISLDTEYIDEHVAYFHSGAYEGLFARLRVKDQGHGMSREVLARAFDPLFTTRSADGHSGLGLSIVFSIVRAHDGFMVAESHPEKGTIITLYLPLKEPRADLDAIPAAGKERQNPARISNDIMGRNESVLVVEDEPVIRDVIAQMLGMLGYKVSKCADAVEALEEQKRSEFDLVLVDMIMPRMNGIELIERLHQLGSASKTLIMTGYGMLPNRADCESRIIPKPFDLETLGRMVKSVLETGVSMKTPAKRIAAQPTVQ